MPQHRVEISVSADKTAHAEFMHPVPALHLLLVIRYDWRMYGRPIRITAKGYPNHAWVKELVLPEATRITVEVCNPATARNCEAPVSSVTIEPLEKTAVSIHTDLRH